MAGWGLAIMGGLALARGVQDIQFLHGALCVSVMSLLRILVGMALYMAGVVLSWPESERSKGNGQSPTAR